MRVVDAQALADPRLWLWAVMPPAPKRRIQFHRGEAAPTGWGWYKTGRQYVLRPDPVGIIAVVVGVGAFADAIDDEILAAPGWGVERVGSLPEAFADGLGWDDVRTVAMERTARRRLWVLVEPADVGWWAALEDLRSRSPGADVVAVLPPGADVMDRIRALEWGCAAVIAQPCFPREVLAWCRAVWRGRALRALGLDTARVAVPVGVCSRCAVQVRRAGPDDARKWRPGVRGWRRSQVGRAGDPDRTGAGAPSTRANGLDDGG